MTGAYDTIYQAWKNHPLSFWQQAADAIDWYRPSDKIFDPGLGPYGRWFNGATCNTCYNLLDRHVENGRGTQAAIIYDSPVSGQKASFSYQEVLEQVVTMIMPCFVRKRRGALFRV